MPSSMPDRYRGPGAVRKLALAGETLLNLAMGLATPATDPAEFGRQVDSAIEIAQKHGQSGAVSAGHVVGSMLNVSDRLVPSITVEGTQLVRMGESQKEAPSALFSLMGVDEKTDGLPKLATTIYDAATRKYGTSFTSNYPAGELGATGVMNEFFLGVLACELKRLTRHIALTKKQMTPIKLASR